MKPEALKDEELWDLEASTGLPLFRAFQGLWMFSDREGRFEWRPRALKSDILPYWDGDFDRVLEALASRSFIVRYTVDGRDYGFVRNLKRHQRFDHKEPPSELPAPTEHAKCRTPSPEPSEEKPGPTEEKPGPSSEGREGKGTGKEGKGEGTIERVTLPGPDNLTEPQTHIFIPDWWRVTDEFASEAMLAGVTRPILDEDVTYWRGRKLGGEWRSIEQFFRAHFPRLAKRRETESFKATKHASAQPNAGKTGWE